MKNILQIFARICYKYKKNKELFKETKEHCRNIVNCRLKDPTGTIEDFRRLEHGKEQEKRRMEEKKKHYNKKKKVEDYLKRRYSGWGFAETNEGFRRS